LFHRGQDAAERFDRAQFGADRVEPDIVFIMCLNRPDSSSRMPCACAARRTYSSPGVVNGSSALLLWQEFVALA
jgi:hypothetical protein